MTSESNCDQLVKNKPAQLVLHSAVFKLMCRCIRPDEWLRSYSNLKWVGSDLQCSTPAQLVLSSALLVSRRIFCMLCWR